MGVHNFHGLQYPQKKKDTKVINLETVVAENNAYQKKVLEVCEQWNALKIQAKKAQFKAAADCNRNILKIEN